MSSSLLSSVKETIHSQHGVLFAVPAIVYRGSYSGRNLVAKNSEPEDADLRGYYPVERWILSKTIAGNDIRKENEGLSQIVIQQGSEQTLVFLKDLADIPEVNSLLFGGYSANWPLTKILDIGGNKVIPDFGQGFGEAEIPPIPAHVHSGEIINGKAVGPGKKEAYFLPPLDVPPYRSDFGRVITRLGLKHQTTRRELINRLKDFGENDSVYDLLNVFEIKPYDGWTILPGAIHAPGPWLTFEIQAPQDDYNLCCWKLGQKIHNQEERERLKKDFQLRGLKDEIDFTTQLIKWEISTDPQFKEKYYRPSRILEEGDWGRRLQIFFDGFYGEGFEIASQKTWKRQKDRRPYGGIIWSGSGTINGSSVDVANSNKKEFLVVPNTDLEITAGDDPLLIYVVFPLE